jgi:hypothetical protein
VREERQRLLSEFTRLDDDDQETLGMYFALYEKELFDQILFLRERLGDVTVAYTVEGAREIAAETLKEAAYRWEH